MNNVLKIRVRLRWWVRLTIWAGHVGLLKYLPRRMVLSVFRAIPSKGLIKEVQR